MPYNKLFINLACSVCTEKYRTSVFLFVQKTPRQWIAMDMIVISSRTKI